MCLSDTYFILRIILTNVVKNNKNDGGENMQNNKNNRERTNRSHLVFKSAIWTLIAIALVTIGYFGAGYLSGSL